jgi:FSR family fosmidomycin resistance protein-like MFS transporter
MSSLTLPASPLRKDATVIGLVGLAHSISHFSQLLLAPLFPWLKDAFAVSYAQLGFLLTIFFVVSCIVQALSGFWVDRYGPRPILFTGLALLGLAALGFASSQSYGMLALFSMVAGTGNGVFHPVDYTLLNRKIGKARLGHAYSVHGITGSLGWALAPATLVPITLAYSWRVALGFASILAFSVLVVLWIKRDELTVERMAEPPHASTAGTLAEGSLDFLKIPAVWKCFGFFFF